MEPRIQYAKTADGVSIAYATAGEGKPLVMMPVPACSHVERGWEVFASLWQPLAQAFRLVWYDSRGSGLSDREAIDFSMDAMIRDLEAVLDRTGLESFPLCGFVDAVPIAVTYAVSHPERVSHLILCDGWAKFADYAQLPVYQMEATLRALDWVLFTETFAQVLWRFEDPAFSRQFAEFMRACAEQDAWQAAQSALEGYDVSTLLARVSAPTLVVHNRNNRWLPIQVAQRLAAGIPNARFVLIDDLTWAPVPALIQEFLCEPEVKEETPTVGAFRTILFTDVEGSTALTQRLGDAKAREVLREHERITRECLRTHGGSEVKTMGDGFMASFGSATRALECAIALQNAFAEWNASVPAHPEALEGRAEPGPSAHGSRTSPRADRDVGASPEPIRVRIGLNAGEPIAEEDPDGRGDLFGTAVIAAARIAAQAQGGEILASNVVRELVAGKGFLFSGRGKTVLRGFDDPVEVYEVRWEPPSTELRTGFDSPSAGAAGGSG